MNIIAFSDTHTYHKALTNDILASHKEEEIDVLICCGDFSNDKKSFWDFIKWFSSFNIKNKIIIGGNHDHYMSENYMTLEKTLLELDIICLNNQHIIINDIKFFGTPHFSMPYYNAHYKTPFEMEKIYDLIDKDTNILLTHTPPHKILDSVLDGAKSCYTGDIHLYDKIDELNHLKCHIFGHIHENHGSIVINNKIFYNVSILNYHQKKLNDLTKIKI